MCLTSLSLSVCHNQLNLYQTIDGRKIPYLQKATIFKMMRDIGKRRSVAVYTNIQFKEMNKFGKILMNLIQIDGII